MMRFKIIGLSILLLSSLAFAVEEETKEEDATWNDYKIIAERNIFNRYRTGAVTTPRQQQVVASEQSYYTLRGITRQSDGYISFIEDTRTANVTRCKKGDAIAEGKISAITIDDITYEYGDKTHEIDIGMNLEGRASNSAIRYYSSSGNGSSQDRTGFSEMGQMPGMGQAQQGDQSQSRGAQGRGMGQFQSSGQTPATGQFQRNIQQQGTGQRQAVGQTQSTGQSAGAVQSQSIGQTSMGGQTVQATTQSITTGSGQGESSEEILERLKERRKKELE